MKNNQGQGIKSGDQLLFIHQHQHLFQISPPITRCSLARSPVACLLYKYTSHVMISSSLSHTHSPLMSLHRALCSLARSKHTSFPIHIQVKWKDKNCHAMHPPHCPHSIRKTQSRSSRTPCIPQPASSNLQMFAGRAKNRNRMCVKRTPPRKEI
jgi:hypothetical protein